MDIGKSEWAGFVKVVEQFQSDIALHGKELEEIYDQPVSLDLGVVRERNQRLDDLSRGKKDLQHILDTVVSYARDLGY